MADKRHYFGTIYSSPASPAYKFTATIKSKQAKRVRLSCQAYTCVK